MAKLPVTADEIINVFGPHKHYPNKGTVRSNPQNPDSLVKTHCCFCGLQCGIQLKVKDKKAKAIKDLDKMETKFAKNRAKGKLSPVEIEKENGRANEENQG